MSSLAILSVLPANYGYTILAGASTFLLHFYQIILVDLARPKAKIEYPQFYAEKDEMSKNPEAYRFNCAQRAHGNTLELLPQMLFGATVSGLVYPIASAAFLGTWVLGRFLFTVGYVRGGSPRAGIRHGGGLHYIGALGIMGLTFATAGEMIHHSLSPEGKSSWI